MGGGGSAVGGQAGVGSLGMGDGVRGDRWVVNACVSATYLQLAAEALGLGNCWVHVEGRPCKKDEPDGMTAEEYLRTFLPIPEGRRVLCAVAIGHSSEAERPRAAHPEDAERVITL